MIQQKKNPNQSAIQRGTKWQSEASEYKGGAGARGYRIEDDQEYEGLHETGLEKTIQRPEEGFGDVRVGLAWDNIHEERGPWWKRLFNKARDKGVDLDLGCLYVLKNGERGAVQAFGELFGSYDQEPFVRLSGDNQSGEGEGDDENLLINGQYWDRCDRLVLYAYIYGGAPNWGFVKPELTIEIPGETPLKIRPSVLKSDYPVCAIALVENREGNMKLTNRTEYYPSHPAMDRAFGIGVQWGQGEKAG